MVVDVSPSGEWHITAPTSVPADGRLRITAQGIKGDVRSSEASFDLVLRDAPLPAPSITSSRVAVGSLTQVTGMATPEARVSVSIRVDGAEDYREPIEVTANRGGAWELTLAEPLSYGIHTITAAQGGIPGKVDSAASSLDVYVIPAPPRIISPADGSFHAADKLPAITGTAVPGARVELRVDPDLTGAGEAGPPLKALADAAGNWSMPMSALAVGWHRIEVAQGVGTVASDEALSVFNVTAAEVGPEAPTVTPPVQGPAGPGVVRKPVTVGGPGTGDGLLVVDDASGTGDGALVLRGTLETSSGTAGVSATGAQATDAALAETGATDVGLLAGGGATLLAAGAAALIYGKRRRAVSGA